MTNFIYQLYFIVVVLDCILYIFNKMYKVNVDPIRVINELNEQIDLIEDKNTQESVKKFIDYLINNNNAAYFFIFLLIVTPIINVILLIALINSIKNN